MRAPGTRKHCSRYPFLADARPRSQRQQQRAPRRRRLCLLRHSVQQPGHVQEQSCVERACASCRLLVSSSHILSFSPQYGGALFVNQSLAWVHNSALASNTANVRLRIRGRGASRSLTPCPIDRTLPQSGGAIYAVSSVVNASLSTIETNSARTVRPEAERRSAKRLDGARAFTTLRRLAAACRCTPPRFCRAPHQSPKTPRRCVREATAVVGRFFGVMRRQALYGGDMVKPRLRLSQLPHRRSSRRATRRCSAHASRPAF